MPSSHKPDKSKKSDKSKSWKDWKDWPDHPHGPGHPIIPEPSNYGLLLALFLVVLYFTRRRAARKNQLNR